MLFARPGSIRLCICLILGALGPSLAAGQSFYVIARSGQVIPGGGLGTFPTNFSRPDMTQAGTVTFSVSQGVFSFENSILTTRMAINTVAPGTGGALFQGFNNAVIGENGVIHSEATYTGVGLRNGIWSVTGSTVALLARTTTPAPGISGATFTLLEEPLSNGAGEIAFWSQTSSATANIGIWTNAGGTLVNVAHVTQAAPGGDTFNGFGSSSSHRAVGNVVAFHGDLTTFNNSGIWRHTVGSGTSLVARTGQAAPGTGGANFGNAFGDPRIDALGNTYFFANTTNANLSGLWRLTQTATLEPIALTTQAAPGGGGATFNLFPSGGYHVAHSGEFVFRARLNNSNHGIWLADELGVSLIALTGQSAPGLSGINFSTFGDPVVSPTGDFLFTSTLTGTGVNFNNDSSVWVVRDGELSLFAREGMVIDVGNGSGLFKTLGDQGTSLFTITDAGVVWRTGFTDSSTAVIFNAAVPEPALLLFPALFVSVGSVLLYRHRRQRRLVDAEAVDPETDAQ